MKRILLLMVLALEMCSTNGSAQEKRYKVEDDGFEWYELFNPHNSSYGAEDKNGNIIIPVTNKYRFYYGYSSFTIYANDKKGIVDKQGYLIVPIEYEKAILLDDRGVFLPHIRVEKDGYCGIYDIYGKCIIPINRRYGDIIQLSGRSGKDYVYYICKHGKKEDEKSIYSICDAAGNVVFTTSKEYKNVVLARNVAKGKYSLAVNEDNRYLFVDKNEKVLWDPHTNSLNGGWPIEIYTKNGSKRNLTPVELNRIMFAADWLDGNTEYFAHAAEYPRYKIDQNGLASGGSTNHQQLEQQQSGEATTIVVEHHRDPIPVQQWQACLACSGMGTMGCDNCGGSGTKYIGDRLRICSRCNGQRVIPCNVCFGNKGQYITVYQ